MRLTDGEGVDVVLNSLSGEMLFKSLSLLKPMGRFLELGKRDFFGNTPLRMRPFRKNISFSASTWTSSWSTARSSPVSC